MTDDKFGPGRSLDSLSARGFANKRQHVLELEARADAQALKSLVDCLGDESGYVRDLAEQAFLRLGEARAHLLVPLLEQGLWYTRTAAARVLGRLAQRAAVPGLFRLTEDVNDTAARAARDALIAIGVKGGAVRLAHALYRMPPDVRRRRMDEIAERDRALGERIERLMLNEELMSVEDAESLSDDSDAVRATEKRGKRESLIDSPSPKRRPGGSGDGNA